MNNFGPSIEWWNRVPQLTEMNPEQAAKLRASLITQGILKEDAELVFTPSNRLQMEYDVHVPIPQPNNAPPLPSLATQWRNDWKRRLDARHV